MEQTRFDYSMKNIPIPSRNTYIKKLIEKTESVIKRIRWKAFFFEQNKDKNKTNRDSDNDDSNSAIDNNFGFKSRKCPPQNEELNNFEADVYDMIKNIEFRQVRDDFQDQLQHDIRKINNSTKAFIPADKTNNYHARQADHGQHYIDLQESQHQHNHLY